MRQVVFDSVVRKFAGDADPVAFFVGVAACAIAVRVAALNHKAGYDAVERKSVIKAFIRKRDKVLDGNRSHRLVQRDRNDAVSLHRDFGMVDGMSGGINTEVRCIAAGAAKQYRQCENQSPSKQVMFS